MNNTIRRRAVSVLVGAASLAAIGVHADSGRLYWGGEIGLGKVSDTTGDIVRAQVNLLGGSATASQDSTFSTFKVLGGYRYTERVDLELAYVQSTTINYHFSGVSGLTMPYTGGIDMTLRGLEYAVNFHPHFRPAWEGLYFRLGAHTSRIDTTTTTVVMNTATPSLNRSSTGTDALLGLGYDQTISNTTKIRYSAMYYHRVGGQISGSVLSIGFVRDF